MVTGYTLCTHMDRSPLLYVHVGLPVQPTKVALDFLTLVSESRVRRISHNLCQFNFGIPRPSVLDLGPMYASDRCQTKASLNASAASALWGGDIISDIIDVKSFTGMVHLTKTVTN